MARILITCPNRDAAVPTGYRTGDVDLDDETLARRFRCICGEVHCWTPADAWSEAARRETPASCAAEFARRYQASAA